ncbi:MAG: DNA mismatch repair endonuclease MutL [Chloroflexota bacterium]
MPIKVLTPEVAARIAAGEVVERPASVVKELVENALDAGASRVAVEITAGGLDSIRVTDDGCGIESSELLTAFERHATSKLADDADLARVLTLGFRGEALPSIAAVAEVEAVSRPPGAESAAYARLAPEAPAEVGSRGAPVGTQISVKHLFGRLPARRKFLRTPSAESNATVAVVTHYALAYPEVRFSLTLDGRQSFATPGSGDLRDAAAAVYGLEAAAEMLVVSGEGPLMVTGLAGPPSLSRASRAYVSLFVNRRWIQNRRLAYAVQEAYQGMLMVNRHPIAVLNITCAQEEVDVNVHPTKAEVRFRDESAVFGALQRAVRSALVMDSPVSAGVTAGAELTLSPPVWTPPLWERGLRREGEALHARIGVMPQENAAGGQTSVGVITPAVALPVLRVIGQFGSVYIIAEGPDGMYMIDQHAAHERVLYEQFCLARASRRPDVQGLLEPATIDLPPRLRALVAEESEALAGHGFEIEPFGEGALIVRSLPAQLARGDVREAVERFLDSLLSEEEGDRRDRVAMSLACHGAIRAGKTLVLDEMRELVHQLEASESPHTCPHGRPTMVHMSADALARGFGRR